MSGGFFVASLGKAITLFFLEGIISVNFWKMSLDYAFYSCHYLQMLVSSKMKAFNQWHI